MGSFSIWHWIIVLLAFGVPIWLIVRYARERRAAPSNTQISGIGGWLAFLAVALCAGFLRNVAEFAKGWPDYLSGFQNQAAQIPLVMVGLLATASLAVHLWVIVALFQKRRIFTRSFLIFWILTAFSPLFTLPILIVPGVTLETILPTEDVGKSIGAAIGLGFWYWYIRVSVRVKNTFVN